MIIIISGTPGTGKTTLAKALAKKLNHKYLSINMLLTKYTLKESYDKKRRCFVIDVKKLNKALLREIKKQKYKDIIIDSHLSHNLPKRYVDLCIITKCELKVLEKRLRKKRYSRKKIRENLDCEIFDICLNEAKEKKHKIKIIDTTKGINIKRVIKKLNLKCQKHN